MVSWTRDMRLAAAPRELVVTNNAVHHKDFVYLTNRYSYNFHKSVILPQGFPAQCVTRSLI